MSHSFHFDNLSVILLHVSGTGDQVVWNVLHVVLVDGYFNI